ncbi:hypothetical protein ACJ72_00888 [Emergomyces africanus]|uniref:Uncharacterized protein n=1 Tax=Emergomyces africanus TaxID=1955775 RepID=A0A1B7P6Y6_9EURO|nr:hypothetical protein ACJ72_00888 [Emergomyces africanus]
MPPSTVFSYLRRDHRRPSPPATSPSPTALLSTAPPAGNSQLLPQLPLPESSSYSPKLVNTIGEPASWFEPQQPQSQSQPQPQPQQHQHEQLQVKPQKQHPPSDYNNMGSRNMFLIQSGNRTVTALVAVAGILPLYHLRRSHMPPPPPPPPPTVNLDCMRPNSAGNDHLKKPLVSPDSQPQTTMLRPDQHDSAVYNSKPTSPWKLTFGKNILSDSSKNNGGSAGSYHSSGSHTNSTTRAKPSPSGNSSAEPTSSNSGNTFIPGRELVKLENNSYTSSSRRDGGSSMMPTMNPRRLERGKRD